MRTRERKPALALDLSRPVQLLLLVLTVSTGSLDEPSIVALIADDPDQSEIFPILTRCLFTFGLQLRCLVARKSSLTVMLSMTC